MRARLNRMIVGQKYTFLCVPKMAKEMEPIICRGGGEIINQEVRSYGVVMSVRKAG